MHHETVLGDANKIQPPSKIKLSRDALSTSLLPGFCRNFGMVYCQPQIIIIINLVLAFIQKWD